MSGKLLATATAALFVSQVGWAQQPETRREQREVQREVNQAQRDAQREVNQSQREINKAQRDLTDAQRDAQKALNQQDQNTRAAVGAHGDQSIESRVAHCLIQANQNEIALLQFGLQNTQNDKVRQAAQSMIRDHEQSVQRLQQFNNSAADRTNRSSAGLQQGQTGTQRDSTAVQIDGSGVRIQNTDNTTRFNDNRVGDQNRVTVQAGYAPQQDTMQQIAEEAARNCLKMTKEELSELKGEKFDKAFVGQQCGAHIQMIAFLKAVENHVSPELQQVVRNEIQTSKQHKDHLEQLKKDLQK